MKITNADVLLGLIAIGISATTGIHWGFTLAISFFLSKAIEVIAESYLDK